MQRARPVVAALAVPRRRAARRADGALGRRRARRADRRQLLADRDRLADPHASPRRRRRRRASSAAPSFPVYGYDVRLLRRGDRRDGRPGREGRAGDRRRRCRPAACRRSGATTSASSTPTVTTLRRAQRLLDVRLGHARRRRLLLRARPHRRRHQRRRPSPRHARDRGEPSRRTPGIAEVAVVGVADALKGQVPVAFAVVKDAARARRRRTRGCALEGEVMETVDRQLGAIARPARVHFVDAAAEDALGQAAAPLDPGDLRGPRPGRPDDDRGPGGAGADPRPGRADFLRSASCHPCHCRCCWPPA